jgi:ABC-type uncharacterized transport system permease subunit
MNVIIFGLVAIALYLLVAARAAGRTATAPAGLSLTSATGMLGLGAIVAHAVALYPMTMTSAGFNLGVFSAASLIGWIVAVIAILSIARRAATSLAIVVLPLAATTIALSLIFSNQHLVTDSPGIALHIALSLIAYSLFTIASLQAVYLAFAERRLKQHEPVMDALPPLPVMERNLFQLTAAAFILLSLGLLVGSIYIEDIRGQHLSHKIVFSLLAWSTFAVLLAGHQWWHWRGRRAVKFVIGGFVLLAVGYFGSKIALELILQRV